MVAMTVVSTAVQTAAWWVTHSAASRDANLVGSLGVYWVA